MQGINYMHSTSIYLDFPMAQRIFMHRFERLQNRISYGRDSDRVAHISYFRDLLTYATRLCNIEWTIRQEKENCEENHLNRDVIRFDFCMGHVVMQYRMRHLPELEHELNVALCVHGGEVVAMPRIIDFFAANAFRGEKFHEGFLYFSILVVHYALYYAQNNENSRLLHIMNHLESIYTLTLKHHMLAFGGWNKYKNYIARYFTYDVISCPNLFYAKF